MLLGEWDSGTKRTLKFESLRVLDLINLYCHCIFLKYKALKEKSAKDMLVFSSNHICSNVLRSWFIIRLFTAKREASNERCVQIYDILPLEQFKCFRIKCGHKASYNIIYQLLYWRKETALILARMSIRIPQRLLENKFPRTSDNFYHSVLIKDALTSIFGH